MERFISTRLDRMTSSSLFMTLQLLEFSFSLKIN